jgi:hypothetical protein
MSTNRSAPDSSPTTGSGRTIQNWIAAAVLVALLLATTIAFVETERLKLVPSPILDTVVSKAFAPQCNCRTDKAEIAFRLRRPGLMALEVVASDGRLVRRLAAHQFQAGFVTFAWYGGDSAGRAAPQGSYKLRVQLRSEHRTILLPNVIQLDRTAPTLTFSIATRTIRPGQRLRVLYRLSEPAHPLLYVDGKLAVKGRWPYLSSTLDWFGKVSGFPVRAGKHELTMRARDLAGNLSRPSAPIPVAVVRRQPARAKAHAH